MKIINSSTLDALTAEARQNRRGRKNLNLHPNDAFCAHRLFNAIEPGSYIRPHRHLDPNKDETFVLIRGRLAVLEFTDAGEVSQSVVLQPGDGADLPAGVWHTAVSLEPGTIFFEAKAGPYCPFAANELAEWSPAADTPAAADYLAALENLFRKS